MSTKCQRQYLKAVLGFNASSNPFSNQQSGFFFLILYWKQPLCQWALLAAKLDDQLISEVLQFLYCNQSGVSETELPKLIKPR